MKKQNKKSDMNWGTLIALIVIMVLLELLGNYCSKHHEEHKKKNWEKFEKRMQEVHYMTKW